MSEQIRAFPAFPDSSMVTRPRPEDSIPEITESQFELLEVANPRLEPKIDWSTTLQAEGFEPARHGRTKELELDAIDDEINRYHRRQRWLVWTLLFAVLLGVGWLYYDYVAPMRADLVARRAQLQDLERQLGESRAQVEKLESARAEDATKLSALTSELEERHREIEAKEALLIEIEDARASLSEQLKAEIARGDVRTREAGGTLVVDLADEILFPSGSAELEEAGKQVLKQVAATFAKQPDKLVQVGGHTDSLPISKRLAAQFPSNWELSAARAINVVRFLEESCDIPGRRLSAAGHGPFRPAASNSSPAGRQRNRRIELVLLPAR